MNAAAGPGEPVRARRLGEPVRWLAGRLRRASAATPLRVKLIAALLVLVTLALTGTGVAGSYALRGYLMDKVDALLPDGPVVPLACSPPDESPPDAGTDRRVSESAFFLRADQQGGLLCQALDTAGGGQTGPKLPTLDRLLDRVNGKAFTVPASGAGHAWRMRVVPVVDHGRAAGFAVFGLSLDEVDDTVGQLILIEIVVGAVVLFVLGALGYTAIRSSLRPLVQVEETAAAIASGDLTRRIPRWPARTEVGRLSGALNGMLAQIETAFAEREEAADRARASETRMRRFVADASHELRTPLTAVRGFAELLRQQSAGKEKPGSAVLVASDRIEQAATRMGLLVEDLLMLARLDQQRPLEARPVDLLALAADAVSEARVAAPDHPVTLTVVNPVGFGREGPRVVGGEGPPVVRGDEGPPVVRGDEDPPVVRGDEAKLRQVIGNLLANAIQHTPPGTAVTVSVGSAGGQAVLEVADEGPGLRSEDAVRVFERFYRVDAARTRASGGTGLGLSIVDSIVTAHGGNVSVWSAPGEGARFRVTLPLAGGGPAGSQPDPEGSEPGTAEPDPAGPEPALPAADRPRS
jgi:two-component system OmpR family sensor kinase